MAKSKIVLEVDDYEYFLAVERIRGLYGESRKDFIDYILSDALEMMRRTVADYENWSARTGKPAYRIIIDDLFVLATVSRADADILDLPRDSSDV